ncbi:hypothetical protein TSUD_154860 [Trifolium subterraneum]|uniref:RNase H type-1 domain-containing protein n=1 Tax=Trifolium subterraneum TaxID=3900 RepID=A0A2Z6MI65_TRISU|nr:hypothetical protein TSUD_154860 [Trifolium subterraneum]
MTDDNSCPRCQQGPESIMHVLRDYIGNTPWSWVTFVGVSVNALWKDRNELMFNQYSNLRQNWLLHIANQVHMVANSIIKPMTYMESSESIIPIIWEPPPINTLNVDDMHKKRNSFSTCGGLLRDSRDGLIQGFYCNLGSNNSQGAKIWSIVHAMRIARHLHLDRVIFEIDFTLVAAVVLNRSTTISYLKPLIEEVVMIIKGLFRRYKKWNPVHPTYGAFYGMGFGVGCGVGWGPGFGPEVVGYVGAGCGVGFNVGITLVGFGIGLPANVIFAAPYNGSGGVFIEVMVIKVIFIFEFVRRQTNVVAYNLAKAATSSASFQIVVDIPD